MKSIFSNSESEIPKNSRRQFLQKGAQTATAIWGGLALTGCGGGGGGGGGGAITPSGAGLFPASGNSNGQAAVPALENSAPQSVNNSSAENSPGPAAGGTVDETFSSVTTHPVIQSFVPSAEVPGKLIVITGAKFDSTAVVSFGGVAATKVSVDSDTRISVTVPALAASGPITVKTKAGASQSSAQFSVLSAPAPAAGYRLAWHDEFDGTSLDKRRWRAHGGTRGDATHAPDAIEVANGVLTISTYTDPETGKHCTGFLDTNTGDQGRFTFGYFEARVRFVSMPGQWSAFWLMSNMNKVYVPEDPSLGVEIDIIEHRAVVENNAGNVRNQHSSAIHWNGYAKDEMQTVGSGQKQLPAGQSFAEWHTVGVLWTPSGYQFFFDGNPYWDTTMGLSMSPEFIRLTSEIKDLYWAGNIPAEGYGRLGASTNGTMQIDWVRVWQLPTPP